MENNAFTTYYDNQQDFSNPYNQLVIEISKSHLVCMLMKENNQALIGFEYHPLESKIAIDPKEILEKAMDNSQLLNKGFKNPRIFFNHEQCVSVSANLFEEELAADYVNAVYGDDYESVAYYDQLSMMPGYRFVYRLQKNVAEFVRQKFHEGSINHIYTDIIKRQLEFSTAANDIIKVQFYNTFFIASVIVNGELNLIQTFEFESIGDILFALLNITKQLALNPSTAMLQLSGMMPLALNIWENVKQHFSNVNADETTNPLFEKVLTGKPLYYFSPYINLVS